MLNLGVKRFTANRVELENMDGTPDWTFLRGREKNENNSWIFTDQRQHWFI